uniref:DUF642 domain-containing protein n=1 Tax=Aegilops tauschii subsp. strangulata TaxID=200361 RepID=A0A453LSX6_AEGTS
MRAAGPLLNGNFEYAPNRSQMNGTRVMAPNAIPYWKVTGFVEYIESGARQGDMVLTVPEGRHAVQLGTESSIRQQLSVTRGKYYSITFSAARTCAQSERLKVSVVPGDDDVADELPIQTVYTSSGWDSYSWAFKAKQGVVSFIIHHGDDHAEDPACGPIIDCVAIRALNPPRATPRKNKFRQHADKWGLRGGAVHHPRLAVGGPGAAHRRRRHLAAAGLDGHVLLQGGQVHRLGALPGAAWRPRRGAGGRLGGRAGPGGGHRPRQLVQAAVLGGRRGQRVRGVAHARAGGHGAREQERAVQLEGHGRVHARRARLHGGRQQHAGGVLQLGLPHDVRRQRHALRARRRRRLARLRFTPACSPVAPL